MRYVVTIKLEVEGPPGYSRTLEKQAHGLTQFTFGGEEFQTDTEPLFVVGSGVVDVETEEVTHGS